MANGAGAVRVIAVLVLLGGLVHAGAPGPPQLEFEDRTRLVYELTRGSRLSLDEIDHLFAGDGGTRIRAYALAGAFVRDLRSLHGESAPAEILGRVARGASFEAAFAQATGVVLLDAEAAFWRRQRLWTTWVPFLTSPTALWMLVTLLAVYAIGKRRQKRAAPRRRWAGEESDWPPEPEGGTGPTGRRSGKPKRGER